MCAIIFVISPGLFCFYNFFRVKPNLAEVSQREEERIIDK